MSEMKSTNRSELALRWAELRAREPRLRMRDAAAQLGVSEAELLDCGANWTVKRLNSDFSELLRRMPEVGPVMALTRNEHVVHEKVGAFGKVSIQPGHGIVLNHDIDLRLFMGQWRFGFAVSEQLTDGAQRQSFQFFDAEGVAIHKIYQRSETDEAAWLKLVDEFEIRDDNTPLSLRSLPELPADLPDQDIDVEGLRQHWSELQDVHDFFGMLKDFKVGRLQAMRLVGAPFSEAVELSSARSMLELAAERQTPIMCFVGNHGCIQIHTGPVKDIKVMGPWLNVLDPGFNLHLREDAIAYAFVVRKPTRDGEVSSLELFGHDGKQITMFFGERKPGQGELDSWRDILRTLPRRQHPVAAE